ncbi:hypothetical protein FJZ55_07580 [Candidatus Woesearchaeota archaeon]|nr:hypothetical protein [Candidatus Woesearchaeota archaeon]
MNIPNDSWRILATGPKSWNFQPNFGQRALEVFGISWLHVCRRNDEFETQTHGDQTMAKNAKPKINAEAAYENAHLVAQDLVTRIGELLFDLPAPGNEEHPIHWGHVGDLSEINSRLSAVIAFMTGTEK